MSFIFRLLPFLILAGCGKPKPDHSRLIGEFEGPFGDAPVTLAITSVDNWELAGLSRHLGVERTLRGKFRFDGSDYRMELTEPGNHPFDGTFLLRMDYSCKEIIGFWFAKNRRKIPFMRLTLKKKIVKQTSNHPING